MSSEVVRGEKGFRNRGIDFWSLMGRKELLATVFNVTKCGNTASFKVNLTKSNYVI